MNEIHGNLIDGEWRTGEAFASINPSNTGLVVGEYARATAADVEDAVAAAGAAARQWSLSGIAERHMLLRRTAADILARKEELGRFLSCEEGKTLAEGMAEAERAGQIFDYYAGEALRLAGQTIPSVRLGIGVEITREPVGVVGIITPWNFPLAIPAWKIAPALCHGNAVIFKPAELVSGCAWLLVDILHRAGLPRGVLNLVMGKGTQVGQAMLEAHAIDAITFTGSVATGKRVAETSAQFLRKVQLEMGGKNPLVVLEDADIDIAADCAVNGAFFSTGQRCTASSRLIVAEKVHDRFVEAVTKRMGALVVDDAVKDGTSIGPVVDQGQLDQDERYIEIAIEEGATLAFGGKRLTRQTPGYFLQPALFTGTDNAMRINREEVFGPVASVIRVSGYDEALQIANDTPFGLTAGICTSSLKYASHFKRNAQAGMVMVNLPTAGVDFHVPFGGRKGSSFGPREQGSYAAEFYTSVKTAYTRAG